MRAEHRVRLSRLGYVVASLGAALAAVGPEPRHPRLIAFGLGDFGDAPVVARVVGPIDVAARSHHHHYVSLMSAAGGRP